MRVVPTKQLTMLAAIGSVLAILMMACGGGKETDPVKLVPEGSTLIAHVNLSGLLASDALTSLIDGLPLDEDEPQTLEEVLDEGMTETGVDFRQISQVSFFTDPLRDEEFTGIIASGDFNEIALISSIRAASDSPLSTSDYRGRKLYSSEDDSDRFTLDDSDSFTLAVLEGEVLVAGTAEAVRAVIDVQDGNRDRLSGGTIDAFNDLGLGLFRLQADLSSSDFAQGVPALGAIPFLSDSVDGLPGVQAALQDLKLAGLVLSQNGQILALTVHLDFTSAGSASDISDFVDGVLKLGIGLIPDAELADLLRRIEISRIESRLTFRLEVASSELSELINSLVGVSSVETATPEPESRALGRAELGREIPLMPTREHLPEDQTIAYSTTPPTSGDHWARWAECGFYEDGLPDERSTHNLEHGNIVISYNFATQQQIDELRSAIATIDLADEWSVTRFYDKIPEGNLAVAAWGRLYMMNTIDRDRIAKFFAAYVGRLGPERIPC